MVFEKVVCDRCKKEMEQLEQSADRKIWLNGVGREGGYDLCNECYYDLFHWFFDPNKYYVKFEIPWKLDNIAEVNTDDT